MTKLHRNALSSKKELLQTFEICRNLDTVPALPALLLQAFGEAALPCPQSANQPVHAADCSITPFPSLLTVCQKKNRLVEFFRGEQFKCLENATPPIASPTNLFQRAFPQSNFCGPQTVAAPGKVDSSFALYESTLVSMKHIRSRHQKDLPWVVHCKACSLSVAALSFNCWYLPETVFS